ncbi:hypothetical protein [Micromonospora echinofusca]|uniref:Uncharacterized protein n=1 Tax=Micromonospora echinofusca TaxID=47858 RepID=A0ABS3VJN7_MICEH|nr:hypothetical protein [Micromonospora echinofusca]MBO4204735.1 hypothetical protein [Micromonospora echinofusca]
MTVYRSSSSLRWHRDEADADAARQVLAEHVPDDETGRCVVCLTPAPCRPANAAANRLVDLGRPIGPPDEPDTRRPRGWRGWLTPRRRPMPRSAPLLTFGWRVRLGLVT